MRSDVCFTQFAFVDAIHWNRIQQNISYVNYDDIIKFILLRTRTRTHIFLWISDAWPWTWTIQLSVGVCACVWHCVKALMNKASCNTNDNNFPCSWAVWLPITMPMDFHYWLHYTFMYVYSIHTRHYVQLYVHTVGAQQSECNGPFIECHTKWNRIIWKLCSVSIVDYSAVLILNSDWWELNAP